MPQYPPTPQKPPPQGSYPGPQAFYNQVLPPDSYGDSGFTPRRSKTPADLVRVALQQNANDPQYQQYHSNEGAAVHQQKDRISTPSYPGLGPASNDIRSVGSHPYSVAPANPGNYNGHSESFTLEDSSEYITSTRLINRRGCTHQDKRKHPKNGHSKKGGRQEGFMEEDRSRH